MSHFYGEIQGMKGTSTRCGSANSGMTAHIRGWEVGVEVVCAVDAKTGKDVCEVWKTGGSNAAYRKTLIATVQQEETK